jgi:hypothetical protein
MPSRTLLLLTAAVFAVLPSCASAPLGEAPHFSSQAVNVTTNGLAPSPEVRIAAFGTVVFRNARDAGAIEVDIARPFAPSAQCSTTLRFSASGDASVSQTIAPRELASICFHESGKFPFTVRVEGQELRGVVLVGGKP